MGTVTMDAPLARPEALLQQQKLLAELHAENAGLRAENAELRELVAQPRERIAQLEAKLGSSGKSPPDFVEPNTKIVSQLSQ